MTQGERIRKARKELGLTLEKFGENIGMKKNSVSQLENGKNSVTEQVIKAICREFNINEEWLRTGSGEMFIELTRDEEIAQFIGETLSTESDTFKKSFISVLSKLDESDWETLEKIVLELVEAQKKD